MHKECGLRDWGPCGRAWGLDIGALRLGPRDRVLG